MREKHWKIAEDVPFEELLRRIRGMTTGQKAVALYLAVRRRGAKGATLNEMQEDMEIGRSTIERAMPGLRRVGIAVEVTPAD